jgi:hypothetical protein
MSLTVKSGGSLNILSGGSLIIGGGGGGGSPSLVNLQSWWRADDISVADGAPISVWPEHQGNGNDLSVLTYEGGPSHTFVASAPSLNGQPAVNMASGSGLRKALPTGMGTGSAPFTLYLVMKVNDIPGNYFPATLGDPSVCQEAQMRLNNYGSSKYLEIALSCGSSFLQRETTIPGNSSIVAMRNSSAIGGNNSLEVNGTSIGSNGGVPNVSDPMTQFAIGGYGSAAANYAMSGLISEVLYYTSAQTAEEITATYNYLSTKYGIAI